MPRTAKKTSSPRPRRTAPKQGTSQETFGFKKVDVGRRTGLVREVFEAVAPSYDMMNDLMSLGIHRLWKRSFVSQVAPRADERILDLAGGTGDITFLMQEARERVGAARGPKAPAITVCDINPAMLEVGQKRATDRGFHGLFRWVEGNAEKLPFAKASFDVVTIAFGLRNVTHLSAALSEVYRVLAPGGRFYCLEFSRMAVPALQKIYDGYSFSVLPWLGEKVAGNRAAYQYLAESIRAFPEQEKLKQLMAQAGFDYPRYRNLSLGIAAVHWGKKKV